MSVLSNLYDLKCTVKSLEQVTIDVYLFPQSKQKIDFE
jgi:hypothetical protein